jgi:hypothetical protein
VRESSSYALQELPKWYPFAEYRRRLVVEGKPLHVVVNGDEIGLQLNCGSHTILATNYDYFDGCQHWIYLLRRDGKPVDQLRMPDEFGFIRDMTVISPSEVAFGYFGTNDRWNLVVHESGFCSYALVAMLRRPNRFLLAKRYLTARRTKGAPWSLPTAPNPSIEGTASSGLRPPPAAPHVKR